MLDYLGPHRSGRGNRRPPPEEIGVSVSQMPNRNVSQNETAQLVFLMGVNLHKGHNASDLKLLENEPPVPRKGDFKTEENRMSHLWFGTHSEFGTYASTESGAATRSDICRSWCLCRGSPAIFKVSQSSAAACLNLSPNKRTKSLPCRSATRGRQTFRAGGHPVGTGFPTPTPRVRHHSRTATPSLPHRYPTSPPPLPHWGPRKQRQQQGGFADSLRRMFDEWWIGNALLVALCTAQDLPADEAQSEDEMWVPRSHRLRPGRHQ